MNRVSALSRRAFLAGAAGALTAPALIGPSRAAAKSDTVTFVGYGGTFQETLEKYVTKPFTEETGIRVNFVPAPDLARIKAQLLMGNVEWDVYEGDDVGISIGRKQGFWGPLDTSSFDLADLAIPPTADSVAFEIYADGIAWDPKKFGPGKHPTNFAEFYDVKKFPGRRALRNGPAGALESALLADGVAPKDMYPLDVDRAFKVLDRIKSSVVVWTAATTQTISLVQTGEVDFSYTYANRVKATNAPGGGTPLAFSFEQNLFNADTFAVVKGAPNKENAMKLIAYFLRPEVQARMENQLSCVPVSKKAVPLLSEDARKWQPDLNNPSSLMISGAYWADHNEALGRRFQEWKLG